MTLASRWVKVLQISRRQLLAAAALIALVAAMQYGSGAYRKDLDGDEDEPAHAVSSLLVRDYLVRDLPHNPLPFAKNYYVHYPKVAIGHWPPGFHTLEALWMLVFGRTRATLLSFVGVAAAALALSVFFFLKRDAGTAIACVSAALLATRPIVQTEAFVVETDIVLALLVFSAAIVYGRYLERRRRRNLAAFVALSLAGFLVHGRAAVLLFVPPVAALLKGRSGWKRRPLVLFLLLIAVVLILPRLAGQASPSTLATVLVRAWWSLYQVCALAGWPVATVAGFGVWAVLRSREDRPGTRVVIALLTAYWIFSSLVNVSLEERYAVVAMPAIAVLFGSAWTYFGRTLAGRGMAAVVAQTMLGTIVAVAIGRNVLSVQQKPDLYCHRLVADRIFDDERSDICLVAGDAVHEGAFIAEMALHDRSLQHIVLRASKVLAASSWAGRDYRLRFRSAEEVAAFLNRAHVGLVLLEPRETPAHLPQLAQALAARPEVWQRVTEGADGSSFRIFERMGPMPPGAPDIRIDLRDKLGQYLENGR